MNANKSALFALSAALVNRPDSFPQIVERNGIVEGDGADDLAVAHLQVPRIRVLVRLAVASKCGSLPQTNDRVAISVDGPHCRYERRRQSGVARNDDLVHEVATAVICSRCHRLANYSPLRVGSQ